MHPRTFRTVALVIAFALIPTAFSLAQTSPPWQSAGDVRVGQRGSLIGTVGSIDSANSTFYLAPDNSGDAATVRVTTETATTRYFGFGQGSEILTGSAGFRSIRAGDRVQVTGIGRSGGTLSSTEIMLLGRDVGTRGTTGTTGATSSSIEGTVRQISANENRLTVETSDRKLITVYGTSSTPVYYQGQTYRISNIEVGDRLRISVESSTADTVRARSIDVIADVRGADGRTLTSVFGRVTRIDTRAQTLRLDAGNREVRIDARNARDSEGRVFRLSDIRVNDLIEVSGSFDAADNFLANTIRFGDGTGITRTNPGGTPSTISPPPLSQAFETIVLYGTVERELGSESTLLIEDTDSDREIEIYMLGDVVVRLVNGSYVTADQLERGTRVVIQALRDRSGLYIAQTVRTR